MHVLRGLIGLRWLHLGAHPVTAKHSYAVQRVLGVWSVLWSIGGGVYLMWGGADQLQAIVWQPLVEATHTATFGYVPTDRCFLVIGGALLVGGLTGYLGLVTEKRAISVVSCAICTAWHTYVFVLFGSEDIAPPPTDDNFLAFYAMFTAGVCLLRFLLLVAVPDSIRDDVMHL